MNRKIWKLRICILWTWTHSMHCQTINNLFLRLCNYIANIISIDRVDKKRSIAVKSHCKEVGKVYFSYGMKTRCTCTLHRTIPIGMDNKNCSMVKSRIVWMLMSCKQWPHNRNFTFLDLLSRRMCHSSRILWYACRVLSDAMVCEMWQEQQGKIMRQMRKE